MADILSEIAGSSQNQNLAVEDANPVIKQRDDLTQRKAAQEEEVAAALQPRPRADV